MGMQTCHVVTCSTFRLCTQANRGPLPREEAEVSRGTQDTGARSTLDSTALPWASGPAAGESLQDWHGLLRFGDPTKCRHRCTGLTAENFLNGNELLPSTASCLCCWETANKSAPIKLIMTMQSSQSWSPAGVGVLGHSCVHVRAQQLLRHASRVVTCINHARAAVAGPGMSTSTGTQFTVDAAYMITYRQDVLILLFPVQLMCLLQ